MTASAEVRFKDSGVHARMEPASVCARLNIELFAILSFTRTHLRFLKVLVTQSSTDVSLEQTPYLWIICHLTD
ncbi:hypothetical protein J2S60_001378 [Gleimia europaea]|nr:hypothetical protein [Gleimia europaea]